MEVRGQLYILASLLPANEMPEIYSLCKGQCFKIVI